MSAAVIAILRRAELLGSLSDDELLKVAGLCRVVKRQAGDVIFHEGESGSDLYLVHEGIVEVQVTTRASDGQMRPATINSLGRGQSFGELVLLGAGDRTATVVCAQACTLLVLRASDFTALCEESPRIGYAVIKNLATELAYKLRSSNLLLHGTIQWRDGQLGSLAVSGQ
jgi:CRP/FNR family transcriptional regulator, cyclic AMP receptor protein